jgi:phage recombination protein Bet
MGEAFRPTLVPPPSSAPVRVDLTKKQLDLVWDMNRDLSPREFDQFIETARALGLSPLSRQVCAIVFNRGQPERRQMAIVTTIAGLRAIADRSDTYRPDDQPARIVYDEAARHPRANPHGIVEGIVTPHRFAHGAWHPVVGQVFWEEIAPIREKSGERWLDSRTPWPARPRGQFIKCCEAAALRLGWPENLANVYAEEEVDRARMTDVTPSEAADQAKKERLGLVQPAGTIIVDLWDGQGLRAVPQGEFHGVVSRHIHDRGSENPALVLDWAEQQRIALRTFFGLDKAAGLDISRQLEALRGQRKGPESGSEGSNADCA